MNKFKSGDKVVRIAETLTGYTVTKGEEYVVDSYISNNTIRLDGIDDWFNDENFELVVPDTAVNSDVALDSSDKEEACYNPLDVQEGGGHYKNRGIQPIEYANANELNPQKFNIVKYITRHEDKGGVEDLSKVVHYALLEAYFVYGVEGSTELANKIKKMLKGEKQ